MKKSLFETGMRAAVLLSLSSPFLALAQQQLPSNVTTPGQLLTTICTIARWMFTFLIVLAIIFVIYAAFKYLTAAGDPEKVKAANHALIYAAVAVAVAILARAVPLVVGGIVSPGSGIQIEGGC